MITKGDKYYKKYGIKKDTDPLMHMNRVEILLLIDMIKDHIPTKHHKFYTADYYEVITSHLNSIVNYWLKDKLRYPYNNGIIFTPMLVKALCKEHKTYILARVRENLLSRKDSYEWFYTPENDIPF